MDALYLHDEPVVTVSKVTSKRKNSMVLLGSVGIAESD